MSTFKQKSSVGDTDRDQDAPIFTPSERLAFGGGFSPVETAAVAGVGRTLIFAEIKAGRLKARKVGRRTVIAGADIRAWLDALPLAGQRTAT